MKELNPCLEAAHRKALEVDGVTCLRQVLTNSEVLSLGAEIDACIQDPRQLLLDYGSNRKVINGFFLWTRSQALRQFLCDSSLPKIAAQLMRSKKINLLSDHLFSKEAETADHVSPWHSDQQNWIVKGCQVVTFWIALDHVTRESGAVQFIRGSHHWDFSYPGHYKVDENYEPISDIENKRSMFDIVHYDLQPGDMTAHYGYTLHFASGNHLPDRRRRGYAIRYTGDDVVYEPNSSFETPWPIELERGAKLDSSLFPVAFHGD